MDKYVAQHVLRRHKDIHTYYAEGKKYVLIAREKHRTRYLDAGTEDLLWRCTLALLDQRKREGWYGHLLTGEPQVRPALPRDQAEALPPGAVRRAAVQEWEDHDRLVSQAAANRDTHALIVEALATQNGPLAWLLLELRIDHEYEGIALHPLETPPSEPPVPS